MNKNKIAKELLGMARELIGTDFPTQDALNKYLKEHPGADRAKMEVKRKEKGIGFGKKDHGFDVAPGIREYWHK